MDKAAEIYSTMFVICNTMDLKASMILPQLIGVSNLNWRCVNKYM